jgi:hypothetical protein
MMHANNYMPYVGITAMEMIRKQGLEFYNKDGELMKFNKMSGHLEPTNGYEQKLYWQMRDELDYVEL